MKESNKETNNDKQNITVEMRQTFIEEDRIDKLEREVKQMNTKIDKLLQLLSPNN